MIRIAIIAHSSHTLYVEDIDEDLLEEKYGGDEQAYIDDNYTFEGDYSWDYVVDCEYYAIGESTPMDVEFSDLVQTMEAKNVLKSIAKYDDAIRQAKEDCLNYLNEWLDENGNKVDIYEEEVYITYDGGNKPEYQSNAYSHVETIYKDNGKIYLDIEDDGHYLIDRVEPWDLINLVRCIIMTKEA